MSTTTSREVHGGRGLARRWDRQHQFAEMCIVIFIYNLVAHKGADLVHLITVTRLVPSFELTAWNQGAKSSLA